MSENKRRNKKQYIAFMIIVLVVILVLCLLIICRQRRDTISYYEYPTEQINSSALIIPDETLKKMSDEALVKAIAEYPYLMEYSLSSSAQGSDRIESFITSCSALQELLTRDTARESLLTYGLEQINYYSKTADQDADSAIIVNTLCDIISDLYEDVTISSYRVYTYDEEKY